MTITIPAQLKSKLPDGSYVFTLCANAEKLFGLNAVYFAEYTNHNAEHVNADRMWCATFCWGCARLSLTGRNFAMPKATAPRT